MGCMSSGFGGLAEAPGMAGRPPRREIRCLGSPASRQTNQTFWKPLPGGQHQDFLVRQEAVCFSLILLKWIWDCLNKTGMVISGYYRHASLRTWHYLPLCPFSKFPHINVSNSKMIKPTICDEFNLNHRSAAVVLINSWHADVSSYKKMESVTILLYALLLQVLGTSGVATYCVLFQLALLHHPGRGHHQDSPHFR